LPLLIHHFVKSAAEALKKQPPSLPAELSHQLSTYHFPGNVRELQAMVFDAVAQHKNGTLSMGIFREHMARSRSTSESNQHTDTTGLPFRYADPLPSIKQATTMLIDEAMRRAGNNQSIAASMLGISQQALSKRLKTQLK
jgi:DNA-binding NtrC family response regulator